MSNQIKSIKSLLYVKNGFEIDQILFKKNNDFKSEIPEKLKKDYLTFQKKWDEKDKNNVFRNKPTLCISKYHIKDKKIYLEFCEEQYSIKQSISEAISSMPNISQDFLISEFSTGKLNLPISYKVNIAIITKDNKLIFTKRSPKVSTNKNKLELGISKGVGVEDFNGKKFQPLVTIARALNEELNINLDAKDLIKKDILKITEFCINRDIFSLSFLCLIDLKKTDLDICNASELIKKAAGAKNSWEHSELFSIDLSKKEIIKFLKVNQNKLTNYSIYHLLKIIENLK